MDDPKACDVCGRPAAGWTPAGTRLCPACTGEARAVGVGVRT